MRGIDQDLQLVQSSHKKKLKSNHFHHVLGSIFLKIYIFHEFSVRTWNSFLRNEDSDTFFLGPEAGLIPKFFVGRPSDANKTLT